MANSDGPTTNASIADIFTWIVQINKFRSATVKSSTFSIKYTNGTGTMRI